MSSCKIKYKNTICIYIVYFLVIFINIYMNNSILLLRKKNMFTTYNININYIL